MSELTDKTLADIRARVKGVEGYSHLLPSERDRADLLVALDAEREKNTAIITVRDALQIDKDNWMNNAIQADQECSTLKASLTRCGEALRGAKAQWQDRRLQAETLLCDMEVILADPLVVQVMKE